MTIHEHTSTLMILINNFLSESALNSIKCFFVDKITAAAARDILIELVNFQENFDRSIWQYKISFPKSSAVVEMQTMMFELSKVLSGFTSESGVKVELNIKEQIMKLHFIKQHKGRIQLI